VWQISSEITCIKVMEMKLQDIITITLTKMAEKRGKSGLNLHIVINILESSTAF
jgi:hypothetical protein